jgi:hypothetical protein
MATYTEKYLQELWDEFLQTQDDLYKDEDYGTERERAEMIMHRFMEWFRSRPRQ